jgi:hypothetical protein
MPAPRQRRLLGRVTLGLALAVVAAVAPAVEGSGFDQPAGAQAAPAAVPPGAGSFVPLSPRRLVDTRDGGGAPLPAAATLEAVVAGAVGVPAEGVVAVALTLTATEATARGFLTLWPAGQPRPVASVLNVAAGDTRANLAVTPLGAGGAVAVFTQGGAHVVLDVVGYWLATGAPVAAGRFAGVDPVRVLDTRLGTGGPAGPLPAGGSRTLDLAGLAPAGAAGVALSVTTTEVANPGFVTVWPAGEPLPLASNLNAGAGGTRANLVLVPLGAGRAVSLFSSGGGHLVADLVGWFTGLGAPAGADGLLVPRSPSRFADTRERTHGSRRLAARQHLSLQVAGREGIPVDAGGVLANLTVVSPDGPSFATAWPGLTPWPGSSNANAEVAGQDVPVGLVTRLGAGRLTVTSSVATDLVVDVAGWFVGPAARVVAPSAPGGWSLVLPPPGEILPLAQLLPGQHLGGAVEHVALPPAGTSGCRPRLPVPALDSGEVPPFAATAPVDGDTFVFGWSARGRPLLAWTRTGPGPVSTRLLVLAMIHGDEDEVGPVLDRLRTDPVPAGVSMTVVPTLNPDGAAAFRRQNGRGVDLNRNFPVGHGTGCWSPTYYGGPVPFSEPESQALAALVDRIRPGVVVGFHSNIDMVISTQRSAALAARYAAVTGQTVRTGRMEGYAEPWLESLAWQPAALLVELPTYADITPSYAATHVRAVWEVAG